MAVQSPEAPPDPLRETAQRPRRVLRGLVLAMFALLLAILLLVGVALGVLGGSERGSAWLLARVPQLSVVEPSGRLFGGAFSARRIELSAGGRVVVLEQLAWRDTHWSWQPHAGAWLGLAIDGARIERVQVGAATAAASAPATAPSTLRLPLALTLPDLRIAQLQIDGAAALQDLAASVELGHDQGREHRLSALTLRADRALVSGSARFASDAPFAIDAELQARSLDGAALPWQAGVKASGPLAAVAVSAQLTSPQAAGAQLDAQGTLSPFAAWPLSALRASMRQLDLSALMATAPSTQLSGEATIDTQGLDKPISARLKLVNAQPGRWDLQRLPVAALELDLSGRVDQPDRLTLRRFELRAPGNAGSVSGQGEWHGSTAMLDVTLRALRPAALDARAPALTLSGTLGSRALGLPSPDGSTPASSPLQLQSQLALEGRLEAGPARARADTVRVNTALQAERTPDGWRLELRDAQARAGQASLRGSLQAEGKANGASRWASQGQAQAFEPAQWWATAPSARLNGQWNADLQIPPSWQWNAAQPVASLLALRGKAQLELRDSALAGVPLQASLRADAGGPGSSGWNLDAQARAANNRFQLQGQLAPRAADDRWRAEIDAPALAALRPLLAAATGQDARAALDGLDGALTGQAQVDGRWPALRSSGTVRASALRVAAINAAQLNAKWQAGPDRESPLSLEIEGQGLSRGEPSLEMLRATIEGTLAAHRIDVQASSAMRPPAWTDTLLGAAAQRGSALRLLGQAGWQPAAGRGAPTAASMAGQWRAQLSELDARGRGAAQPWLAARDLNLSLSFDDQDGVTEAQAQPGRITVLGATLTWRDAHWTAARAQRPAQVALEAQLEPMAIAPWLARWQPEAGIGGDLTVKASAIVKQGPDFSADVVLERAAGDLTVTTDGVTQSLGLSDLRLALAADQGTWYFTQALAGANMGVLAGAVSLRTDPGATWPAPETPMQGVLEWRIADLGVWAPFTPPGWRVGGQLRTSAAIGGRFGGAEIEGRMEGSGLALRNLLLGVDLRDGDLLLSLRGADARVERFVFKGGDGELRLSGGAVLGEQPKATLQIVADKFRLLGRTDRRVVTSGEATLVLDAKSLAVNGRLRIDEGLIDVSRADAPALDSDVTVHGGRHARPQATLEPTADPAPPPPGGAQVRDIRVAVALDLGDSLRLRGRGLDTRLTGRLDITAPNGRVALNGQVRTAEGQYAAYGQKLDIQRGVLVFSGETENPRLDILAVRPNLDVEVGVQVSGTAQSPRVRLVSTPEMSEYDKLSWLVLGRAPDSLGRSDTALLQGAALALLSGEGQGSNAQLLSRIGLDELSLRQVESGNVSETVVTVGKQLSQRWYVGYERSVNNTTGTWQLIYRVAQRFTLRAQSGTDNALDVIWTWRWN